jgi:hypothetical protein
VSWPEVLLVFIVCHAVGDFMLQTDWQALNKRGGLGRRNPEARRALLRHIATYTLAFVPACVWLADDIGAGWAAVLAAGVAIPHLVQDDGRLLTAYINAIKGRGAGESINVFLAVDQSFHLLTLFATALIVTA